MKLRPIAGSLSLLLLVGCGEPSSTPVGSRAPHGGTVFPLSNGLGDVEVVRAATEGKPTESKLFLYFVDAAGQPAPTPPTAAKLKPKGRGAQALNFKPTTATDPARAGALESDPLRTDGEFSGELATSLGGKPATAVIELR